MALNGGPGWQKRDMHSLHTAGLALASLGTTLANATVSRRLRYLLDDMTLDDCGPALAIPDYKKPSCRLHRRLATPEKNDSHVLFTQSVNHLYQMILSEESGCPRMSHYFRKLLCGVILVRVLPATIQQVSNQLLHPT